MIPILTENDKAKVGIFFKISRDFLTDSVPLSDGDLYGDAVGYSGHYDFHENLDPSTPAECRFKAHDYDYYPRGRVVYFPKKNSFVLYTDPCLTPDDIIHLICLFVLDGQTVEVAGDEHYRCATCNKHYLE
ncbi:MAG: hypothetical protein H7X83_09640 [Verrucomicrobia bacterium]|nr:hypothetical protein [Deltaproteobacteria bacterium]